VRGSIEVDAAWSRREENNRVVGCFFINMGPSLLMPLPF